MPHAEVTVQCIGGNGSPCPCRSWYNEMIQHCKVTWASAQRSLRAASKLTEAHIHFQQQKMKVQLAAQTLECCSWECIKVSDSQQHRRVQWHHRHSEVCLYSWSTVWHIQQPYTDTSFRLQYKQALTIETFRKVMTFLRENSIQQWTVAVCHNAPLLQPEGIWILQKKTTIAWSKHSDKVAKYNWFPPWSFRTGVLVSDTQMRITAADVLKTWQVANMRIHADRAISRMKWYHIVNSTLPLALVPLFSVLGSAMTEPVLRVDAQQAFKPKYALSFFAGYLHSLL